MPSEDDAFPGIDPAPKPLPQEPIQSRQPQQPQSQPRYVPVLSEVIGAQPTISITSVTMPAATISTSPPPPRVDATVQAVLCALGPEFDQRLAETMSRVLHEQLQGLHARVRQAVAREMRAAVMAALKEDLSAEGSGAATPVK